MRDRSLRSAVPAALVLVLAVAAAPALLLVACNRRFGHPSPLHGLDAPWRWTLDSAHSWLDRIRGHLDTSRELIDLFLRIGFVIAWACVLVLVATIVGEVVFQLRHGMPSSGRRSILGLARLGRVVATGLVALLPLASATPALAGGPTLARSVPTASIVPSTGAAAARTSSTPPRSTPGPSSTTMPSSSGWQSYEVRRGDSVWSIAARFAAPDDVPALAQQIVDANRGATMADGRRFTTPALIEPGWQLLVPADERIDALAAGPTDVAPAATVTAAGDASIGATHVVVAGDSYWAIADAHLADVRRAPAAERDVLAYTNALIAHNGPLLGHRDQLLILAGEVVELVPLPDTLADPATVPTAADIPTAPPPAVAAGDPTPQPDGTGDAAAVDPPPDTAVDPPSDTAVAPVPNTAVDPPDPIDDVPDASSGSVDSPSETAVDAPASGVGAPSGPSGDPSADVPPVVVSVPAVATPRGNTPTATTPVEQSAGGTAAVAPPPQASPVPPATTGAPPTNPSTTSVGGASHEDEGAALPVGLGLAGAVVLATGAIALLDARRRRRMRAAHVGLRLQPSPDREVVTERVLRSAAAPDRLARLDLALRAAALDVADGGARILAAEMADDGAVRLHVRGSATPSGSNWRLDIDGGSWLLPARITTESLAVAARQAGMPCPALAHLGATSTGQLFVDLEAIGVLHVDVARPFDRDIVRCLAASMALSPFAATSHIVTVGLEREVALGSPFDVEQADSLDAAIELAAGRLGTTRTIARGTSTFALRARSNGGESWEPAIVFAAGAGDEEVHAGVAGDGLAIVTTGSVAAIADDDAEGGWCLRVDGEHFVFEPLGIAVTPCGLGHRGVLDVRSLLATAEVSLELRARVVPIDAAHGELSRSDLDWRAPARWLEDVADGDASDADEPGAAMPARRSRPFVEPDWSLLVRVLGQVAVGTCDGAPAIFERSKALELVVWLTQHRHHSTRTGARTALWDADVRDTTFANVVSDARRAMARATPPPNGEEWLARTLTEELPLHARVITDAELLEARVAQARGRRAGDAIEILRPGLELVTGMPFAGTSYSWTDAEGIATSLTLLVVGAATELAGHCLTAGDVAGVFWATGQGLKALPGHEELIALRMRAHARSGDLAGVRHEWEAYERALDADPWEAAQPSSKLVALRHELLATTTEVAS